MNYFWHINVNRNLSRVCLLVAFLFSVSPSIHASTDPELHLINSTYQELLTAYLMPSQKNGLQVNVVDYAKIKIDPRFPSLLKMLEVYPKERLDTKAKMVAFYLNAYNILAINKVAENWPLYKLKSLGTFYAPVWTHPAGTVCEEKLTLRVLEHKILRQLGEPRIHLALNCASVSCPDLRHEPYLAEILEFQLDDQTKIFLSQEGKGAAINGNKIELSAIFDWFSDDFESEGGVAAFVSKYLPPPSGEWEIDGYFKYDWDVNDHLTGAEKMKIKRRGKTWF